MRLAVGPLLFVEACAAPEPSAPDEPDVVSPSELPRADPGPPPVEPLRLRVVTFNTGSGPDLDHDGPPDDGAAP